MHQDAKLLRTLLRSKEDLEIYIPKNKELLNIQKGFELETAKSYKYSPRLIEEMGRLASWVPKGVFTDTKKRIGLGVFKKI
jgi:hypothetical protein